MFLPLPGIEPRFLGCPARGVVTILTELHRLLSFRLSPIVSFLSLDVFSRPVFLVTLN